MSPLRLVLYLIVIVAPGEVHAADIKPTPGFQILFRGKEDRLVEVRYHATGQSAQLVIQARNFDLDNEATLRTARLRVDAVTEQAVQQLKNQPQYRNLKVREVKRQDSREGAVYRRTVDFRVGEADVSTTQPAPVSSDRQSPAVESKPKAAGWEWTAAEQARIASLERQVATRNGLCCLEGSAWKAQTDISARFVAELTLYMDIVDGMLRQALPGSRKWQAKPTIRVFGDKGEFETKYGKTAHGKAGGSPANLWVHLCVVNEKERDFAGYPKFKLVHEAVHAVMFTEYTAKTRFPPWFDEGLACYLQSWDPRLDPEANRKEHDSRSAFLKQMRNALIGKVPGTPSLRRLTTMSREEFYVNDPRQISIHYYAAESFISYLMSTPEGRAELRQLFQQGFQGKPVSVNAAKHEPLWHKYVREIPAR